MSGEVLPSGTLRISQHAFQHVCTRLVGWWRTKPRVDNSWRTEPGPVAAPDVKIGSYWRTMPQQSRIRCKGYSEPPDRIPAGSYQGTIAPDTYIGPVTAVHVGRTYVTICVQDWWINVWKMTRSGTRAGVFFAMQVPEDEVHRWTESGWYNTA